MIGECAFRDCSDVLLEGLCEWILSLPDFAKIHCLSLDWYVFHGPSRKWESSSEDEYTAIPHSTMVLQSCFLSFLSPPDFPSLKIFEAYGHNCQLFDTVEINGIKGITPDNLDVPKLNRMYYQYSAFACVNHWNTGRSCCSSSIQTMR